MSKTKIFRPSTDAIVMMTKRGRMTSNGAYEIVKSTLSSIYDPSVHGIDYRSYLLLMSVF